ncbi:MAG: preprotein translocase subunit YajC [Kiritimatiellae bacterium]|nr:preprotein translocase subunit YajC [Kiritimatiellia bacterium]
MNTLLLIAQAGQPAAAGSGFGMLIPMILVFGIFYFILIRPQQRKEKERLKMISELRVGQRIVFGGGFIGTVVEARENTFMVEIAPKVAVEIARGAVNRVIPEGEKVAADPNA